MLYFLCLTGILSEKNWISTLILFFLILTSIPLEFCFIPSVNAYQLMITLVYKISLDVSLKPVNLKPFYIKPYLTHESEIKFAETEMEKLHQMGILCRGSSEFPSPIMLIKKSPSGVKFNKAPEYRLVVDFNYLNSHLQDIKFSYPEIKHVLHKIGRHSSRVYSMFDLKHVFHYINLAEESTQYTNCSASSGSPTIQQIEPRPERFTYILYFTHQRLPTRITN